MRWFTADTHFGHARIIEMSHRPFKTVEEMDWELVKRWNAVVALDDEVFHLGDFGFHRNRAQSDHLLSMLAGRKHLVRGNHDHKKRRARGWQSVEHYRELKTEAGPRLILCHYPFETWNLAHHGSIHLHGHSHGTGAPRGGRYDVGVDNPYSGFAPWEEDQAMRFAQRAPYLPVDHHRAKENR